jgi:hypothetical protein
VLPPELLELPLELPPDVDVPGSTLPQATSVTATAAAPKARLARVAVSVDAITTCAGTTTTPQNGHVGEAFLTWREHALQVVSIDRA